MKKFILVFCLTILTASFMCIGAQADGNLMQEDFNDGANNDPWNDTSVWDYSYCPEPTTNAIYNVSGSVYRLKLTNTEADKIVISNKSYDKSIVYTAKVWSLSNSSSKYSAMIFGFEDINNYQRLSLYGDGTVKLEKISGGSIVNEKTASEKSDVASSYNANATFTLEIAGDAITVKSASKTFFESEALTGYNGGKIGFGVCGQTAGYFDDISVSTGADFGQCTLNLSKVSAVNPGSVTVNASSESLTVNRASSAQIVLSDEINTTNSFKISADIKINTLGKGAGIVLNHDGTNYVYLIIFKSGAGKLVMQPRGSTTVYPHTYTIAETAPESGEYHLDLCYADGIMYISLTDKSTGTITSGITTSDEYKNLTTSGRVGFYIASGADASFSNVEVEERPVMLISTSKTTVDNDVKVGGRMYFREGNPGSMIAALKTDGNLLIDAKLNKNPDKHTSVNVYSYELHLTIPDGTGASETKTNLYFWDSTLSPYCEKVEMK